MRMDRGLDSLQKNHSSFYRGNMIKRIPNQHGSGSVGIQIQRALGKGGIL
jgi:hypothetical protein